jgi:hypothetical protein
MKQARPQFYFYYIYRGIETVNTRKLEEHVKKNEKDKITT